MKPDGFQSPIAATDAWYAELDPGIRETVRFFNETLGVGTSDSGDGVSKFGTSQEDCAMDYPHVIVCCVAGRMADCAQWIATKLAEHGVELVNGPSSGPRIQACWNPEDGPLATIEVQWVNDALLRDPKAPKSLGRVAREAHEEFGFVACDAPDAWEHAAQAVAAIVRARTMGEMNGKAGDYGAVAFDTDAEGLAYTQAWGEAFDKVKPPPRPPMTDDRKAEIIGRLTAERDARIKAAEPLPGQERFADWLAQAIVAQPSTATMLVECGFGPDEALRIADEAGRE